ncbi:T9SS type A sorting domain-containing protein [Hymenobacter sp. ASUV-10]|uniref:T9SS type A sorting domain-containing protein n=1 Tax=Hymenobacter aranciens TaxID=3063996 RepID=A0ABT9BAY9_9BACT|nr:T9SS type A sorting domain-containing protein [Hymenobacter sp. ASUV-10]MDO7875445.1 T9SS type A sorting domain-containing protein [Hymenobacter sp. ASUV-10]
MRFLPSLFTLLLVLGCWLGRVAPARATHVQGGQLTYLNVGNNQYVVTLYLYRDCSAASTLPASMTLMVRNGCSGTTQGTYPMNPVPNSVMVGTQYCPAQQQAAQCVATAPLPNYQTQQYRTATVTIQPGQWLLSTEICCRPSTANLVGQANFRYEATLNNQIMVNGQAVTIQNSSPQYSPQDVPVPFVPVNQQTTISFNTNDPDNTRLSPDQDSLVYSLTQPLEGCNVPVPYQPYPVFANSGGPCIILPPPATPATYTAQLPVAVGFTTTGSCPLLQGVANQFYFNAAAGQFTFSPVRYLNTPPQDGSNKYVVVGRVDDYRRLPGSNRRYLVGSVRREIFVVITNSTNAVPAPPSAAMVTGQVPVIVNGDSLDITIQPCNYAQILVRFTDPDPLDQLTVAYTGAGTIAGDVLQNGDIGTYSLTGNGTRTPVARFQFQPSPAHSGQVLRIPFQIQDNACPIRGLQTRVLIVRIAATRRDLASIAVVQSGGGTPTSAREATVCVGGSLQLRGSVTRPDSVRGGLQTYNYAWTGAGIVSNANQATITINPVIDTRYRLTVTPASGFQTGVCGDTASILVRVVPQPAQPSISRQGPLLVSSASGGNQWFVNNSEIPGATSQTHQPTQLGSYTVAARTGANAGSGGCSSTPSAAVAVTTLGTRGALAGSSVEVLPNPTPDGHLTVQLTGYRQATTLTLLDALGRTMRTATITAPNVAGTSLPLDLSQLPAGVYALRVSTPGGIDVRRVVRQ